MFERGHGVCGGGRGNCRFALRGMEATVSMGQTVLRHFPEDGEWLEASVADYDEISRQHRLVYHLNTTEETFEWLQLAALGPDLLRFPSKNPASNATMYQCDSCQRSFDSLGGLRMHSARWCPNLPQNQTCAASPLRPYPRMSVRRRQLCRAALISPYTLELHTTTCALLHIPSRLRPSPMRTPVRSINAFFSPHVCAQITATCTCLRIAGPSAGGCEQS